MMATQTPPDNPKSAIDEQIEMFAAMMKQLQADGLYEATNEELKATAAVSKAAAFALSVFSPSRSSPKEAAMVSCITGLMAAQAQRIGGGR